MTEATKTSSAKRSPWVTRGLAVVAVLAIGGVGLSQAADAKPKPVHKDVPVNAKFEGRSGIRITRISVVGDGGLVDVRFIVLDPQKAHAYVGDDFNGKGKTGKTAPAPKMRNAAKRAVLKDIASMHQHADYVAGQAYYLLYLNPSGAIKAGDKLDVEGTTVKENYAGISVE
jgi:hypothetical protein